MQTAPADVVDRIAGDAARADAFAPTVSTVPSELAAKLAGSDPETRRKLTALLTTLLAQYRVLVQRRNVPLDRLSGAFTALVTTIYAVHADPPLAVTSAELHELAIGLRNYALLLQSEGRALDDERKQRLYDAIALESMLIQSFVLTARASGNHARATAIADHATAMLNAMFRCTPQSVPFPLFVRRLRETTERVLQ